LRFSSYYGTPLSRLPQGRCETVLAGNPPLARMVRHGTFRAEDAAK
jgi:hypothetical protein